MKQIFSKVKYDTKELIDSNIQMINLEYYKIFKENRRSYGIEIVKTELKEDREIIENKKLKNLLLKFVFLVRITNDLLIRFQ